VVNLMAAGILLNLSRFSSEAEYSKIFIRPSSKTRKYRYYYKVRRLS